MNLNRLSRALFKAARATRDINAVTRGPEAIGKRVVNKAVYRESNKLISRALRNLWKG